MTQKPNVKNTDYFIRAERSIPSGVTSTGRVRETPLAFQRAAGSHLTDLDGNDYVDCVMGLGPIVIGHGETAIVDAVRRKLDRSILLAAEDPDAATLAERIIATVPSADRVIFANSGSEAVHAALRVARAATGRTKILKFEGHYHGWIDPMHTSTNGVTPAPLNDEGLVKQTPGAPGEPDQTNTLLVTKWNDSAAFDRVLSSHGEEIAAVIMEPIPFNFGAFRPAPGYLEHVRAECTRRGIILIFDEVVSGVRVAPGGAQEYLGVTPDITVLAKAIAGGFTLAAVAGTEAAMSPLIERRLRHSGTYNANPISLAAGVATFELMSHMPELHETLEHVGSALEEGITTVSARQGIPLIVNRVGSALQVFAGIDENPTSYDASMMSDRELVGRVFDGMAEYGAFAAPRGLIFLCARHTDSDIERVLTALDRSLEGITASI